MIINNVFISYDNQWDTSIHIYICVYSTKSDLFVFPPASALEMVLQLNNGIPWGIMDTVYYEYIKRSSTIPI